MDMVMQHGHEHAAWTWPCSTGMDMQHLHGQAACALKSSMDMDKYMLNVQVQFHVQLI
jgi:hypothetical protein